MIDNDSRSGAKVNVALMFSAAILVILAASGWFLHLQGQNEIDALELSHETDLGELQAQLEKLNNDISWQKSEFDAERERLIEVQRDLQGQLEAEKERVSGVQGQLEAEKERLAGLQRNLESELQTEKEHRDALERELGNERDASLQLRQTLAAEQESATELQAELNHARETQMRLEEELEREVARLNESNGELQRDLQDRLALQQALKLQIAEVSGDVDARQAELDNARQHIEKLNLELERSQQDQGELKVRYAKLGEQREQETRHFSMLQQQLERELKESRVEIRQLKNRMTVINLTSEVLFASGSARIKPAGQKVLDLIAASLNAYPERAISVEGHTDNVPVGESLEFKSNWELSAARAMAAIDYLQSSGSVDPARLRIVGHGEYHPVASNETSEGRQQNRRIEIRLLPNLEFGS